MFTATLLFAIFGVSNVLARPLDLQTEAASVDIRTIGKRSASAQTSTPDWAHGGDCASDNLTGCVGGHGETADNTVPPHPAAAGGAAQKRWINPPPTIPVGVGTACSLETCDMCPTFPGCDGSNDDSKDPSDGSDDGSDSPPRAKDQKRWTTPITTLPTEFGTACSLETCDMCPSFPGCGTGEMRAGHKPPQPPVASAKEKRDAQDNDPATKPVTLKKGNWEQPPRRQEKREANISPIVVSGGAVVGAGPECSVFTCDLCPDHPGCLGGGQTWDSGNDDGDGQP